MAKTNNSSVPAFGMKDRLGYMFGDFGNDFCFCWLCWACRE